MADPPVPTSRSRTAWAWVKVLGGLGILAVLAWRLGTGGFRDGLRVLDPGTLLAAGAIGALTTVLSAWRWCLVARGLGIPLRLPTAVADYYRALFLNAALPGGILGDVHRAVGHGRGVGDLGLGVRSVLLERTAGQAVIVTAGVVILLASPVPLPPVPQPPALPPATLAALAAAAAGLLAVALLAARRWWRGSRWGGARWGGARWGRARWRGTLPAVVHTVRCGLLRRRIWPGVVATSVAVLAGYLATFLIAARAAGSTAPAGQLLPLLVLALVAMMVPLNVGGWGPREGACAWAFGAAGLGATQGLAVAVAYGVAVLVASVPGAGVLAVRWVAGRRPQLQPAPGPVPNRSDSA